MRYRVMEVLPDGVPREVARYAELGVALNDAADRARNLRPRYLRQFFVGVLDAEDYERGWLGWDEEERTA